MSSDSERRLVRRLDIAGELARIGAQPVGRDLCGQIFLEHSALLLNDRHAKQRFVECLLLLKMNNLLTRLLSATEGVELRISTMQAVSGPMLVLSFPAGNSLSVPIAEMGTGRSERERFAAIWSERILKEVENAAHTPQEAERAIA